MLEDQAGQEAKFSGLMERHEFLMGDPVYRKEFEIASDEANRLGPRSLSNQDGDHINQSNGRGNPA